MKPACNLCHRSFAHINTSQHAGNAWLEMLVTFDKCPLFRSTLHCMPEHRLTLHDCNFNRQSCLYFDTPLPAERRPDSSCLQLQLQILCSDRYSTSCRDVAWPQHLLHVLCSHQHFTACRDVAWLCLVKASGLFCIGAADGFQVSSSHCCNKLRSLDNTAWISLVNRLCACCPQQACTTWQQPSTNSV